MSKRAPLAGASRWSSLFGVPVRAGKAENDPNDPDARAESENTDPGETGADPAPSAAEDDDDCPACEGTGKDGDDDCEACDGTGDKPDDSMEDSDDDEKEMRGASPEAKARRRERQRVAVILGHRSAKANLPLAASLALETNMTRKQAIAVLQSQRGQAPTAPARSAGNPRVTPGGGERQGAPAGSTWNRAFGRHGVSVADKPLHRG